MLKAVICDVDGTLLDTEKIYLASWKQAGREMGYDVTDEVLLSTRSINAKESAAIFERMIGGGFNYKEVYKRRVEIAEEVIKRESPLLLPGVTEMFAYCRENGIRIATATSTNLEKTMDHLRLSGIDGAFDVIVTGDMIERSKPQPDIFLKAAELLGIDPAYCAVMEDSPAGIRAAYAAGMKPVLIPNVVQPTDEICALAYTVLPDLTGVIPILKEM